MKMKSPEKEKENTKQVKLQGWSENTRDVRLLVGKKDHNMELNPPEKEKETTSDMKLLEDEKSSTKRWTSRIRIVKPKEEVDSATEMRHQGDVMDNIRKVKLQ
ncbi:hypothetical protein NDU88_008500 [Pleurodeles waltl]|uniref:Uncharacterized protein n=1 Tax=Pleurodeles waltl TaxID=8319 RepID=A0AAV7QUQ4_PLEWA|nr:hypothetical protein NDU88_008500 [Pleurodeles waltl]